ncbi:hypothetical protein Tco_0297111, partial [Tanacetum coccineum]
MISAIISRAQAVSTLIGYVWASLWILLYSPAGSWVWTILVLIGGSGWRSGIFAWISLAPYS